MTAGRPERRPPARNRRGFPAAARKLANMAHMTAELTDGTEIRGIEEVVEGSNGVHLKKEVKSNSVERVAYIPYPNLVYVYHDQ